MFENSEKIFVNPKQILNDSSFSIVHFNDIYDIECSVDEESVGGAARFISAIEGLIADRPSLVVFSGDALSPSLSKILITLIKTVRHLYSFVNLVSTVTKGKHMIDILNKCHLICACLGNHEFDFGLNNLKECVQNSNFPWLISNVIDSETKKPLGDVEDKKIVEINGVRIGFIALVEEDWTATLSAIDPDDIEYETYIDAGKRLANELRNEHVRQTRKNAFYLSYFKIVCLIFEAMPFCYSTDSYANEK